LGTYRAKPRRSSRNSADTGAGEKPQLPTTSVVTPCRILDSARRLAHRRQSECECMSMKPGVSTLTVALRVVPARSRLRSPTAVMVSSDTPTSTREPDAPVPSMTVAPSILRSSISSVESGGPRYGPPIDVRGPDMAPHTPQRSSRPGQAVALLDPTRATPISPPTPPSLGSAPAKPWRSSIQRKRQAGARHAGGQRDRRRADRRPWLAERGVARPGQARRRGRRRRRRQERVVLREERRDVVPEADARPMGRDVLDPRALQAAR